jgi:hypothetical protein
VKKPNKAEQMECKYSNRRSFELLGTCNCGTGDFDCQPARCDAINPADYSGQKFDEDGDGVNDYYKMMDAQGNAYDLYFLSRKSPYNTYNTIPHRGASAWTDTAARVKSSFTGDTCLIADADVVSSVDPNNDPCCGSASHDSPAQTAGTDTLSYELDFSASFGAPIPYSWGKAGDLYSFIAFGNVIKVNGGEMPATGQRVKMGTCYTRCADDGTGSACTSTGFLPTAGTSSLVTSDASALCGATGATQA